MRQPRLAILLHALVGLGVAAGASGGLRAQPPPSTPATAAVVELVRAPVPRGLAARLPNPVAWQRAFASVREARYGAAAERFRVAAAELASLASPCDEGLRDCGGRLSRREARRLVRVATLAEQDARTLQLVERELGDMRAGSKGPPLDAVLRGAGALRRLYLLDRALRGEGDRAIADRAHSYFQSLSTASTDEVRARGRLGLACLRADTGDPDGARVLLAQVPLAQRGPEVVDLMAHLRAELGEPDRAFEALEAARDALPEWDEVAAVLRVSSDLDRLRDDARFERLFGEP